ncbi:MAG: hypothetical protein OXC06_01940 [Acidimicrobiaceae bacterium]|nr:hypothetical protein [Acidimicrobiaceae bacterium]
MPGARLVLLTSGEGSDAEPLRSALASWCRAGLLGAAAWSPAQELASGSSRAECEWADGRAWACGPLSGAVSQGLCEVWLAALRGPARGIRGARQAEEDALEEMHKLFGSDVTVRSLTVAVPGPNREFGRDDFSAMWDYHLVHDRRVAPDTHSATEDASEGGPLALTAAVALCAAGGWSGADAALDLTDRSDGPVKDPRIVHAQQRVLHAPDLAFLGIPGSPPWPAPREAGVRRALPGSVPDVHVAERLASQAGFKCRLAPAAEELPESAPGLWDCLFGPLRKPRPRTEAEDALRRLAHRTGGFREPDADGMVRLNLGTAADDRRVAELVDHIRHSSFPIGHLSAGTEGATPETWRTVRGAFFGLVDGAEMPPGVPPVTSGEGRDGEVLVWSDPSALAPLHLADTQPAAPGTDGGHRDTSRAAGDAQPRRSQPATRRGDSSPPPKGTVADSPASPTTPGPPSRGTRDGDAVPVEAATPPTAGGEGRGRDAASRKTVWEVADGVRETDAGESTGRYRLAGADLSDRRRPRRTDPRGPVPKPRDGRPDPPPGQDTAADRDTGADRDTAADRDTGADRDTAADSGLDEWLAPDEDAVPTGGDHDALMSRLAANLDAAVRRARRNFERCAAARPSDDEYERARHRRPRVRAVLAVCGLLMAAAVAAAVDQRWPYLAIAWEAITPWGARPAYGPAIWPAGWFAVIIAVAAIGGLVLRRSSVKLRDAVSDLREGERLRHEHIAQSVHYAAELVRLQSLSEQFADHRRIITEMLHRPFGDPGPAEGRRLDVESLCFDEAPPPSMLVAAANASTERVEDEQRKLQADVARRGWLTSAHHDVLEAWRARYSRRVLDDRPDPDSDASIPGALASRDQRDGSEVLGAREDYANAVHADGWAVRDAHRARWRRLLAEGADREDGPGGEDSMERYLALLETLSAVHGPAGVADGAADFLALGPSGTPLPAGEVRHRFAWRDVLGPHAPASAPPVNAIGSGPSPITADAGDGDGTGAMVLMSWRLEYSEQVRAEHLRGWTAAAGDGDSAPPKGGVI